MNSHVISNGLSQGCCCFGIVSTSEIGVIENFGKYSRLQEAGCFFMACPCEYMSGKVSLRVLELTVRLETKTKDNVFVDVSASVQYQVIRDKVYKAYYALFDTQSQMRAYICDVIRSAMCELTLDEAFETKDEISIALKKALTEVMSTYGISIVQALVTELMPDQRVMNAMNEINSSKRLKEAAAQRAEGEKVLKVKRAEAEAEAMYLSGLGVARQRKAIMMGLKESIQDFTSSVSGASSKDVMDLLVLNQYFDTLQQVGTGQAKVVFLATDMNEVTKGLLEGAAGR
ncbi:band 7 family-domain-containing protein [Ochromonadaceae sp. CCMP2298]|nr:band 7 family-domain-containing protein [Ochromonadaceae sp. CCMP2298]|mmetsp:Transcript_15840/g.35057  ORF Transcript_15840/g.35057 Transcript_15840/m.35057 type:complete len:287 (-) Transcript_15840:764-1624(-)|eukprot:CAMPEP_0173186012 /NCGR_PEP_ID=MMETSP1141-20130122/9892_1 /TAXON_ID=483371 /ORGANISM="non described non described, Strain CCMP2298" /LENGTH=286 /DNA_ID=CAMNT_0014109641 /DNA_START=32 /DNA_END=892 /DNA_ORIENTATION=-